MDHQHSGQSLRRHPYTQVIWSVNGTVSIPGPFAAGATNVALPDSSLPNGTFAAFWTDLDLCTSGRWYVAIVTTPGGKEYTAFEWNDIPHKTNGQTQSDREAFFEHGHALGSVEDPGLRPRQNVGFAVEFGHGAYQTEPIQHFLLPGLLQFGQSDVFPFVIGPGLQVGQQDAVGFQIGVGPKILLG